ncbi:MAG TPA: cell envelope integrity EipB family protein [Xanthobacteraceae bacterium]
MELTGRSLLGVGILAATAALSLICSVGSRSATAPEAADELASHRAIYELTLAHARGNSPVAARGRILYDFSGNACDGYALQFRQVSELDNGEGKVTLSDLRSTTWEDGAARKFVYKSQNFLDEKLIESVEGQAERQQDKLTVTLVKPADRTFELDRLTAFPTDHMRRIIEAARAEKRILEVPLYDGSEKGDRIFSTLSVIGRPIRPDEHPPNDAAAGEPTLAALKRWPVTVSYFDKAAATGDQTPVYAISFELYENGVSRALMLEYNDFSISGKLTSIEFKDHKPCR